MKSERKNERAHLGLGEKRKRDVWVFLKGPKGFRPKRLGNLPRGKWPKTGSAAAGEGPRRKKGGPISASIPTPEKNEGTPFVLFGPKKPGRRRREWAVEVAARASGSDSRRSLLGRERRRGAALPLRNGEKASVCPDE